MSDWMAERDAWYAYAVQWYADQWHDTQSGWWDDDLDCELPEPDGWPVAGNEGPPPIADSRVEQQHKPPWREVRERLRRSRLFYKMTEEEKRRRTGRLTKAEHELLRLTALQFVRNKNKKGSK